LLSVAQTPSELRARYPLVESYAVRPDVLLTAKFAVDGQPCELTMEKRHNTPEVVKLDATFSAKELDELTEELSPVAQRGLKADFTDHISIDGPSAVTVHDFENVSITEYATHRVISRKTIEIGTVLVVIRWKHRPCESAASNPSTK
jgi:hypothetical protein